MFDIVAMALQLIVEAADHPAERPAMGRDETHFLIELLAAVVGLVPAGKGRKLFIAIIEIEQQVSVVGLADALDIGIGCGGDQLGEIGEVGIDFHAAQMRATVHRFDVARRTFITARAQHAIAVILAALGLRPLEGIGEIDLQILAELDQQLVAGRDRLLEVQVLALFEVRGIVRRRHAVGAARLRQRDTRRLEQQRIIDEAGIIIIARRRPEGDMVLQNRDVDDTVNLVSRLFAVRLGIEAAVHFAAEIVGVGTIGNVANGAGQSAQAIQRSLRPQQRFHPRDVEQLEIIV